MNDELAGCTVILLGAPLSGKSRLCEKLHQECGFVSFEFGKMLRQVVERQSNDALSEYIKETVRQGTLLDDEVAETLFRKSINISKNDKFVTDGFPRTHGAVPGFLRFMNESGRSYAGTIVVHLQVDSEQLHDSAMKRKRVDDLDPAALSSRIHTYDLNTLQTLRELSKYFPIFEFKSSNETGDVFKQLCDRLRKVSIC